MIYDPDALLALVAHFAEREGVPIPVSRATLRTIVVEAEQLAAGQAMNEPAALFYASARRSRLFGKVAPPFLDAVGGVQADRVGLYLDATPLDIVLLRGQVAFDTVGWEEVRDAFGEWLRPAGVPSKPSPRKRPR
jgi:hypothetical protein